MDTPLVSVIIVHYNTPKLLKNCLYSLYKTCKEVSFEVIIVDNNSNPQPNPKDYDFPQLTWSLQNENLGFAKANNVASKQAKGTYLFLLNSDTIIIEDSLQFLASKMEELNNVGLIGPRLLNKDRSLQAPGSIIGRKQYQSTSTRNVSFISGAAMFIKKTTYSEVGGFDEAFFFYNEDVDLCWMLKKTGYRIIYCPETELIHLGGGSSHLIKGLSRQSFKSSLYMLKKHLLSSLPFRSKIR
jgi:GT2 family glycosyltransferase